MSEYIMSESNVSTEELELLENLKLEATSLGIKFTGSATINSLSEKIESHKEDLGLLGNKVEAKAIEPIDDIKAKQLRKRKAEAKKLHRVRITYNDRKLQNRTSILRSVGNNFMEVKKMIPFDVATHVPGIILETMRQEQYVSFGKKKVNGVEVADPKYLPTFNIQELKPLTLEEYKNIQMKQQSEGRVLEA